MVAAVVLISRTGVKMGVSEDAMGTPGVKGDVHCPSGISVV